MKKTLAVCLLISIFLLVSSYSEKKEKKLPSTTLKNRDGANVNSANFSNKGKPYIIALWAVWCPHCHKELANINEVYEDWIDETAVKLIAISIDDSRTAHKAIPYADAMGWEYELYFDSNSDFKRLLGVNALPYIAVVNSSNNIIYERFSYSIGDEDILYNFIKELL